MDAKTLGDMPVNALEHDFNGGKKQCSGITLRQHFAGLIYAQFMQGAVLPVGYDANGDFALAAERAAQAADALIRELAKESQP